MGGLEGSFDTKLHEAVRYGDLDEIKAALQQGHDPNLIGLYQWSALHEAAHTGEREILKLLLAKKGDPNKQDYLQSRTAVHYAAEEGHIDCLQLLVDAGGRYDIRDANGKNCLDVATPGGRRILEKLRVKDLMLMSPSDARKSVLESTESKDEGISPDVSAPSTGRESISGSDNSSRNENPVLGYLHMSVEYHSTKESVKIRVWQLSDLLLPPANTSMIHTVYVKSYLQPDKHKDTKRKTEEVKVEGSEGHIHLKKQKKLSVQHVFTPMSFKFTKALEYSKISGEIINTRHLQLEVCMTQRYTHRSFLIGMLNIPMKSAVKKVVKDKYPLIPCMNHTIPSNMRVYSASEMKITSSAAKVFYSNPNFRILLPDQVDDDESSERAVSNPDLQEKNVFLPSTEIDMTTDSGVLVPRLNLESLKLDESGYSSEHRLSFPGELESPENELPVGDNSVRHNLTTIDTQEKGKGRLRSVINSFRQKVSPRSKHISHLHEKFQIEGTENETPREVKVDGVVDERVENWKYQNIKKSGSGPETMTWDYYDVPTDVVTSDTPVNSRQTTNVERGLPVMLPMKTSLQLRKKDSVTSGYDSKETTKQKSVKKHSVPAIPPEEIKNERSITENQMAIHSAPRGLPVKLEMETSFQFHKKADDSESVVPIPKERVKKRAKEKQPVPGRAIPLVPTIIVTNADGQGNSHQNEVEVSVHASDNVIGSQMGRIIKKARRQSSPKVKQTDCKKQTDCFASKSTKIEIIGLEKMQAESVSSEKSFIVDIDKIPRQSPDSFVVEMDELTDMSELFSEMSVKSSQLETDLTEDFSFPERFSPTKHIIPSQVFIDDMSDSDAESLPFESFA